MKFYDFLTNPDLSGTDFLQPSWAVHREVIARLWDGDTDQIPAEFHAVACRLMGVKELPPPGVPAEMYLCFGRRSGKTRIEAAAAVHAWAEDYRDRLAPREWATIGINATNKRQARNAFELCQGMIEASPLLRSEMKDEPTATVIESNHQTRIEIFSSDFRSVRGFNVPLAIIDEASFLRDEFSSTPDVALRNALLPTLVMLNGRLFVASSPHRRAGLMFEMHRKYFGKAA